MTDNWSERQQAFAEAVESDDRTVRAEEPVEDRLARAYANGWREGFMRGMAVERGHRLDHS